MRSKLSKADITPVRQRTQFSCLAASMSMALKCHGQGHCDEDTVNRVMGAKPMQGATWEQALACAQHYGMRGTLTSPCTLTQLKAWTDAGVPVIIAWNPEGREWSHASVVFDVDDEWNVHVADPNIPDPDQTVRVVPKSEFYAKWYEKWPKYLVRRPAMAIEREITQDGRQVMASGKEAIFFQGVTREMDRLRREKLSPFSRSPSHPAPPSWRKLKEEEEEAPKVKSWVDRLFDKTGESEEGVVAGKKERRSLKDKSMARFLQHGPVRPTDKSDAAKAMGKAQWEARKEEGRAGLPGAGLGAGFHKDKSRYDRGQGKSVEREAGSLTQPLMTRRDYGVTASMNANDYASILKYAVNLPADVERYVEGIKKKNPDYSEGQAWATAWSIYCKYKNPGSEHCQMNKSDYFPGRTAAGPYEIMYRVPGKGGFKIKGFKDQAAAQKWVEKFVEKEGDDVEVRWPAKTAKFPAGKSMTIDEVAEVVGPEFKEMNEDPPESVKKVMEGMQGKTARRSPLLAMDAFAEMLRDSKFEKGVSADPTENMSPEDAAEWKRQNEEHADEFKTADLEAVLHRDDDGTVPFDLFFNRMAAAKGAGGKWGFTKSTETACTAGVNKLSKAASRIAKALYAKDEGSPAFLQKHAAKAGSKTASMLLKAMEEIGPMAALAKSGKTAGKSGNGLYGFTEKTAKLGLDACSALHHEAGVIAADLFARKGADPVKVAGYLAANAKKGKCAFSEMLAEVAPDVALEVTGTVKKKATDFLASDENADDEVADIISKC